MPFSKEAKLYNLFHRDRNYKKEARELRKKYPNAKTVLEVGSGTGLLTKELIKQEFDVTCIEPSFDMYIRSTNCVETVLDTLQNLKTSTFQEGQFDIVVAMYDVLNYIPRRERAYQVRRLLYWGKELEYQIWSGGVKFFTVKRVKGWTRLRFAINLMGTVHIWFVYIGKQFFIEKHTMYL